MAAGAYQRWTAITDYYWTRELADDGVVPYQSPFFDTEDEVVAWCVGMIETVAAMDPIPLGRLPRFMLQPYTEVRDENTGTLFPNPT